MRRFFYRAIKRPPRVSAPECRLEARQGYHGNEELLLTAKAGRESSRTFGFPYIFSLNDQLLVFFKSDFNSRFKALCHCYAFKIIFE